METIRKIKIKPKKFFKKITLQTSPLSKNGGTIVEKALNMGKMLSI